MPESHTVNSRLGRWNWQEITYHIGGSKLWGVTSDSDVDKHYLWTNINFVNFFKKIINFSTCHAPHMEVSEWLLGGVSLLPMLCDSRNWVQAIRLDDKCGGILICFNHLHLGQQALGHGLVCLWHSFKTAGEGCTCSLALYLLTELFPNLYLERLLTLAKGTGERSVEERRDKLCNCPNTG